MNCNLKKVLKAVVSGAKSTSEIKETTKIRNLDKKVSLLQNRGYITVDPNGYLIATEKGQKTA